MATSSLATSALMTSVLVTSVLVTSSLVASFVVASFVVASFLVASFLVASTLVAFPLVASPLVESSLVESPLLVSSSPYANIKYKKKGVNKPGKHHLQQSCTLNFPLGRLPKVSLLQTVAAQSMAIPPAWSTHFALDSTLAVGKASRHLGLRTPLHN